MSIISIWLYISQLLFAVQVQPKTNILADAIKGDFNGDGKTEHAWIIRPKLNKDETGCIGPCEARINFSDPQIKPIILAKSIGGTLTNLGDLNNDGKDDIGLVPDWFTSCWRSYITYTLKNGSWKYLVAPFPIHCNQWESNVKPLEKIAGRPGYLKENYSAFEKDSIVVKSKQVRVH